MFKKILVPLEGSGEADGILPFASWLAKGLGMPFELLSVIYVPQIDEPNAFVPHGPTETAVSDRLEQTATRLNADGVRAEAVVVWGRPAETIV